ncbi:Beta-glucosidase 14 [Forsythia ovata]|uniref:Beta-glucosidase 14 n=1 Tax=Forsythia ovata TaxID=205694 RepID=A0ABD1TN99_9LAMI
MRVLVGKRLPKFTLEESNLLKGSYDYLGINYYTSNYAADLPLPSINNVNISYSTDSRTKLTRIGDANITTVKQGTNDPQRVNFYRRHLLAILQAIRDGVNVKGIFPWSFLDNFEWGSGYTQKFGLVYVDRKHRLKRYPKKSAFWFKKFLQ